MEHFVFAADQLMHGEQQPFGFRGGQRLLQREALRPAADNQVGRFGVGPPRPLPLAVVDEDLLQRFGSLPEHERLVVTLCYLDGHAVPDVARLTGRPVGTVTKQLSRAVERLKSILNEVNA